MPIDSEAGTSTESERVRIATNLWQIWAGVALWYEAAAHHARTVVERGTQAEGFQEAFGAELHSSLICVVSCAHSIDALYGTLVTAQPSARKRCESRDDSIRESFKMLFHTGKYNDRWVAEFTWLFDLRDKAVHHESATFHDSRPHPSGVTSSGWENEAFCSESARRAVDLMLEVLDVATSKPKKVAEKWASGNRAAVEDLAKKRSPI
jgi:hypothetical protein